MREFFCLISFTSKIYLFTHIHCEHSHAFIPISSQSENARLLFAPLFAFPQTIISRIRGTRVFPPQPVCVLYRLILDINPLSKFQVYKLALVKDVFNTLQISIARLLQNNQFRNTSCISRRIETSHFRCRITKSRNLRFDHWKFAHKEGVCRQRHHSSQLLTNSQTGTTPRCSQIAKNTVSCVVVYQTLAWHFQRHINLRYCF